MMRSTQVQSSGRKELFFCVVDDDRAALDALVASKELYRCRCCGGAFDGYEWDVYHPTCNDEYFTATKEMQRLATLCNARVMTSLRPAESIQVY